MVLWRRASKRALETPWNGMQDELRGTTRTLEHAMAAMRPLAQRFSMALGATAPEPQAAWFGVSFHTQ